MVYLLKMVIFNSYVKLLEGIMIYKPKYITGRAKKNHLSPTKSWLNPHQIPSYSRHIPKKDPSNPIVTIKSQIPIFSSHIPYGELT